MKKGESFHLVAALYFAILLFAFVSSLSDFTVPPSISGSEDTLFTYNLTANLSQDSWDEGLLFSVVNISAINYSSPFAGTGDSLSGYPWISLNSSTGILSINSTFDNQTALFTAWIVVTNSSGQSRGDAFNFNISPVNDAPLFTNLENKSFNMSSLFSYQINASDEESNTPFKLNLTFMSCSVAQWSTRNCSTEDGRMLFNISDSSSFTFNNQTGQINLNFTPARNDVGSYILNFTLTDSGNTTLPHNASRSRLVNFTVLVVNSPPYFTYLCDGQRTATENSLFTCLMNATDIDEINNITFRSNQSFFTFNNSNTVVSIRTNSTYGFNATANISFTPSDASVGNWWINITLNDTGSPTGLNSTVISFNISNVNDRVIIQNISPVAAFTSENYSSSFINAWDDDLLIPDKSVLNEVITFYSNDTRVVLQNNETSANRTMARIIFNGSQFSAGTHYINITANDTGNVHSNSTLLIITFTANTAPEWDEDTAVNITLNETTNFYYNFTKNVSDADADSLSFTYVNFSNFPGFNLNTANGILNFTPADSDVGTHQVLINVTDGISSIPRSFTFTVMNVNDTPVIESLAETSVDPNLFIHLTSFNVSTSEDNETTFELAVFDEDFNITQKSAYNESLTLSLNISGPNTNLFSFVQEGAIPFAPHSAQVRYRASFTPNKTDVGNYNVTLTVTDRSNLTDTLQFNVSIEAVEHNPTITQESNKTSSINRSLAFDLNGTDVEDGNDSSGNLTYRYAFLSDGLQTDFINSNQSIFNTTDGRFNMTFNSSQAGRYHLNITVNDTVSRNTSMDFWIFVYDAPTIIYPPASTVINLTENVTTLLSFNATHSVGDNLTFAFFINNISRTAFNYSANVFANWSFTPNFTDETYGRYSNLTLLAYNPTFPDLNTTRTWSTNITHTNAPVTFAGSIPNAQANYDQTIEVNLEDYFGDIDSSDTRYNQTLNFTVISNMSTNSSISRAIINGSVANNSLTVTFSASSALMESFNITATDSSYSNISNSFTIEFTTPTTTPESGPSGSSSSGGGGSTPRPIALNIIVPGTYTAKKQDRLIVPVTVSNDGAIGLRDIVLRNSVAKNGIPREDLVASFDTSFIPELQPGDKYNLTLIVDVDTSEVGLYEVTLNGTSAIPPYTDTAKLYVNVEEGDTVSERISFTEEFIAQNPQCIEINELLDQARVLYAAGNVEDAEARAEDALEACERAIAQSARAQQRRQAYNFFLDNGALIALAAMILGIFYYWFRRNRLQETFTYQDDEPNIIK